MNRTDNPTTPALRPESHTEWVMRRFSTLTLPTNIEWVLAEAKDQYMNNIADGLEGNFADFLENALDLVFTDYRIDFPHNLPLPANWTICSSCAHRRTPAEDEAYCNHCA